MDRASDGKLYVVLPMRPAEEVPPSGAPAVRDYVPSLPAVKEVAKNKIQSKFQEYVQLVDQMVTQLGQIGAGFSVDEITLHLAVDAEVGLAFVGSVDIEGAVDIVFKRVAGKS
jgi:hypothetical protein